MTPIHVALTVVALVPDVAGALFSTPLPSTLLLVGVPLALRYLTERLYLLYVYAKPPRHDAKLVEASLIPKAEMEPRSHLERAEISASFLSLSLSLSQKQTHTCAIDVV